MKISRVALIALALLAAVNGERLKKKPAPKRFIRRRKLDEVVTPPPPPPEGFPDCHVEFPEYIGDGWCDGEAPYNTPECGYDSGDCCEGTCKDGEFVCGVVPFNCKDPTQPTTPPPQPPQGYPDCHVDFPEYVGDGFCDGEAPYNTPECGYDSGDCCPETCNDGEFVCGVAGFDCRDPTQPTTPPITTQPPSPPPGFPNCYVDIPEYIGDGWCDSYGGYNTEECGYDGGDCCEATCIDGEEIKCGENAPFDCQDPSQPTTPPITTQPPSPPPGFPNCHVDIPEYVGDGWCDSEGGYNTEECGYDGGDCCEITCIDGEEIKCGENAPFDCKDPSQTGN